MAGEHEGKSIGERVTSLAKFETWAIMLLSAVVAATISWLSPLATKDQLKTMEDDMRGLLNAHEREDDNNFAKVNETLKTHDNLFNTDRATRDGLFKDLRRQYDAKFEGLDKDNNDIYSRLGYIEGEIGRGIGGSGGRRRSSSDGEPWGVPNVPKIKSAEALPLPIALPVLPEVIDGSQGRTAKRLP